MVNLQEAGRRGGSADKHCWTEGEKEIVRRDYQGNRKSTQALADKLGVTFYAVRGKAQDLGLARRGHGKTWTPDQDEQLISLIHRYAPRTIAVMMKRTITSVVVRAKRLQLHRRYRDGWYTKKEVCEILGVDHKWVQARIDCGALVATWHDGTQPTNKLGSARWHITRADLRKFLCSYPEELMGRNIDVIQVVDLLVGLKPPCEEKPT